VPVHAVVTENLQHKPYTITGETVGQVRENAVGKQPVQGFDGQTIWYVTWRFWHESRGAGCVITRVTTKLDLTIIVPRLETRNAELKASFEEYSRNLMEHELGHAETGRDVARRIDAGIAVLTAPTCPDLERKANDLGYAIVREGNDRDKAYDIRTEHGATQGARWPKPEPKLVAPVEETDSARQAPDEGRM
jgi:predicted secreted Zn-dependent protease